ncbi:unnamed protein product [Aspergillus oryzae]|nr:unnamed protein product [Aspergillus oryzae]GMF85131.1 unnamed protein product [Aspergillus oryzae]
MWVLPQNKPSRPTNTALLAPWKAGINLAYGQPNSKPIRTLLAFLPHCIFTLFGVLLQRLCGSSLKNRPSRPTNTALLVPWKVGINLAYGQLNSKPIKTLLAFLPQKMDPPALHF